MNLFPELKAKLGIKSTSNIIVIAEACDNHLGDMNVAKEMVRQAKLAGADVIKFQHHLPEEEMLEDVPISSNFNIPLFDFLKKYALKLDDHKELIKYCREVGIAYLCTPFSLAAAIELNGIGQTVFKIGSGEFSDHPYLRRIASFADYLILSSGMSTLAEIDATYTLMREHSGSNFALMNCVSEYPPKYEDLNLGFIDVLLNKYPDVLIGHSDHTPDIYTCFAAVTKGAQIIEKHVILDKKQPGPDQSVSIDFFELKMLVDGIRKIEKASGSERLVHGKEKEIREWAHRSVVSLVDIPAGTIISEDMIWTKRPGTGIPSKDFDNVIGKQTKVEIKRNKLIQWGDLI